MRVLFLLLIFNFITLSNSAVALEIYGSTTPEIKGKLDEYFSKYGIDKVDDLLDALEIKNYIYEDGKLFFNNINVVKKVEFRGNYSFLNSTLSSEIGFYIGDPIYSDVLKKGVENIISFYKSNGYRDTKVSYDIKGSKVIFFIEEGKLYLMRGVDFIKDNILYNSNILGSPEIYTEDAENKYSEIFLSDMRKNGFQFSKIVSLEKEEIKGGVMLDFSKPAASFLSFFPGYHKNYKVIVNGHQGEPTAINIYGVDSDKEDVAKVLRDNFIEKSTFYRGVAEEKIRDLLKGKLYVNPDVDIDMVNDNISVFVTYSYKADSIKIDIEMNDSYNLQLLDKKEIKSLIVNGDVGSVKDYIINNLVNAGYLKAEVITFDYSTEGSDAGLHVIVAEGKLYTINDVFVNNKTLLFNLKKIAAAKVIDDIRQTLTKQISQEAFLKSIGFQRFEFINDHAVNVYFIADSKTLIIGDIVSNSTKTARQIKKDFFRFDNELSSDKLRKMQNYLINQKNASVYNISVLDNDNSTDIVVYIKRNLRNQIFGTIAYDNIDLVRAYAGYRVFDFFDSGYTFQAAANSSKRETGIYLSLFGQRFMSFDVENIFQLNFRKRDESDYEFNQSKGSFLFSGHKWIFDLSYGISMENLHVYNSQFDHQDYSNGNNDFIILGIPLGIKYKTADYNLLKDSGAGFSADFEIYNPLTSNGFYKNEYKVGGYFTFLGNKIVRGSFEWGNMRGERENIPVNYRYTLGGPYAMKAFGYREIGPSDAEGRVYGGKHYIYYNVMAGLKFDDKKLIIGPFIEAGSAFDSYSDMKFYKDIGVEASIITPLGPLNLSYAYNFFDKEKSNQALYLTFDVHF